MEQGLAYRGDGKELIDTKVGGVYEVLRLPPVYDKGVRLLIMQ